MQIAVDNDTNVREGLFGTALNKTVDRDVHFKVNIGCVMSKLTSTSRQALTKHTVVCGVEESAVVAVEVEVEVEVQVEVVVYSTDKGAFSALQFELIFGRILSGMLL